MIARILVWATPVLARHIARRVNEQNERALYAIFDEPWPSDVSAATSATLRYSQLPRTDRRVQAP